MHKKEIVIFIFSLFLSFSIFPDDVMNRQIGIIYLKNATVNYLSNQYDVAEAMLDKTREFFPESSDYEYISALISLNRDNNVREAITLMERAIKNSNWLFFEKKRCVKELSGLFLRIKEYKQLLELIENNTNIGYEDNDLMYIYLIGLKNSNNIKKYNKTLKNALKNYPKDYRFAYLCLDNDLQFAKDLIEGKYVFTDRDGTKKSFLKAALYIPEADKRLEAIDKYLLEGGNDPKALIEYYRIKGLRTKEELLTILESNNFFENPKNVKSLLAILGKNKLRDLFKSYYNSYSGNVYYDFNEDGYYEELHLFENGMPIGISIDHDQDGIIEYMIVFENEKPLEIIINNDGVKTILFNDYPYVGEYIITNKENRIVYSFLEHSIELDSYSIRLTDNKLIINEENIKNFINNKAGLQNMALKTSTYKKDINQKKSEILKEQLEKQSDNYSLLSIYDKMMGNYIYQNKNGKKTIGLADIDLDNIVDIKEIYKDGKLETLEVDENKNGIYEFKIIFSEDGEMSLWDFNEDTIYDCKQYLKDGVTINEYSSALDGEFDVTERIE